jgi:nicotinamidase-related amidase
VQDQRDGHQIGTVRFEFPVTAARAALLVVDMQRLFLEPGSPLCVPGGLAMIPTINDLVAHCREREVPVLYSGTIHQEDGSDLGLIEEGALLWRRASAYLVNPEWQALHPELKRQPGENFFAKTRYSAFYRTSLEDWLVAQNRDTLIICGVATIACCAATARDAYFRDIRPIVLSDMTATYGLADMGFGAYSPEDTQRMALADLARHCARVVPTELVRQELAPASDRRRSAH